MFCHISLILMSYHTVSSIHASLSKVWRSSEFKVEVIRGRKMKIFFSEKSHTIILNLTSISKVWIVQKWLASYLVNSVYFHLLEVVIEVSYNRMKSFFQWQNLICWLRSYFDCPRSLFDWPRSLFIGWDNVFTFLPPTHEVGQGILVSTYLAVRSSSVSGRYLRNR